MVTCLGLALLSLVIQCTALFEEGELDLVPVLVFFNEDPNMFLSEVTGSPRSWAIFFYDLDKCNNCEEASDEFHKAARHNAGIVHFGVANCATNLGKQLCSAFKIFFPEKEPYPTILFFSSVPQTLSENENRLGKLPFVYQGEMKAVSITHWALGMLPITNIVTLKDSTADLLTDHPGNKAILFSQKNSISPLLKSLAAEFSIITPLRNFGLPFFRVLDTQTALVERFQVSAFPTLLVVDDAGLATKFTGHMNYTHMKTWLLQFAEERNANTVKKIEKALAPVDNKAKWNEACPLASWCFVAFLDPTDEFHEERIEILQEITTKHPYFRFLWIDATRFSGFQRELGAADGSPQAVLLAREKRLVRPMRSAFSVELIAEFLEISKQGKGKRIAQVERIPEFVEDVTKDLL